MQEFHDQWSWQRPNLIEKERKIWCGLLTHEKPLKACVIRLFSNYHSQPLILCRSSTQVDGFEFVGFVNANFVKDRQKLAAANHEESSVSNKSHSAHNWHLPLALMQAINVSWYQPVCRETLFDRLPSRQNCGGCSSPPDFAVCIGMWRPIRTLLQSSVPPEPLFCRKEITHIWNFRKLLMRDNSKESKW